MARDVVTKDPKTGRFVPDADKEDRPNEVYRQRTWKPRDEEPDESDSESDSED